MRVNKVINNNVLSVFDEKKQELVLMGRGLDLKQRPEILLMRAK